MSAGVGNVELDEGDAVMLDIYSDGVEYRGLGTVHTMFADACLVELPDGRRWWVPRSDWSNARKLRRTRRKRPPVA